MSNEMLIRSSGYNILRVGMAITFLWIGILIFKAPEAWGGYLSPWAAGILPVPLEQAMISTAILDIIVGLLLLMNITIWPAALLGAFHLGVVLTVSGINEITVRDIGLLTGCLALMADNWPKRLKMKFLRTH